MNSIPDDGYHSFTTTQRGLKGKVKVETDYIYMVSDALSNRYMDKPIFIGKSRSVFDSFGNQMYSCESSAKDSDFIVPQFSLKYDNRGHIIEYISYKENSINKNDSNIAWKTFYYYDRKGFLAKIVNNSAQNYQEVNFIYNKRGKEIGEVDSNLNTGKTKVTYHYSDKGKSIETKVIFPNGGTAKSVTTYDKDITETDRYGAKDSITEKLITKTSARGKVIESDLYRDRLPPLKSRHSYDSVDAHGNVVKEVFDNGFSIGLTETRFEYY